MGANLMGSEYTYAIPGQDKKGLSIAAQVGWGAWLVGRCRRVVVTRTSSQARKRRACVAV